MKQIFVIAVCVFLAAAGSVLQQDRGWYSTVVFNLGLDNREAEIASIKASVALYNRYSAQFYTTAGAKRGLNPIPAAPLLKRRIFKDINLLAGDGLVMIFDKDSVEVTTVYFIQKDLAVAESAEVWFVALQMAETRKPVTTLKYSAVKVRYLLHKEPDRWLVSEVDVYPEDEEVPPFGQSQIL